MNTLRLHLHAPGEARSRYARRMSPQEARDARAFHEGFDAYAPTPLVLLDALAGRLGVKSVAVKDESPRFGLNAFKVLGSLYAIGRHIAQRANLPAQALHGGASLGDACRRALGDAMFFTATDGNHGRGVAWAARELGCRAVVRMPAGTVESRVANIRALGAQVSVEPLNYDQCVRLAARQAAQTPGGVIVQDTAWPGYEQIPLWIMQGYLTMALEADKQLGAPPTHIFLQAGVGSMAAAVAGYFCARYPACPPRIIVVEAAAANCFFRSAQAGRVQCVRGALDTMMAGLACGEPSPIAWDILSCCACAFVSCEDQVSALGMRLLAAPSGADAPIVSGESGAVCAGALWEIMADPSMRSALALDADSRVLLFSTEGATDPENYRRITGAKRV